MSTAASPTARRGRPADPAAPVAFRYMLAAEFTKLRSVRSTRWSLAAAVVVCLGGTVLATWVYTRQWDTMSPEDRAHVLGDPTGLVLQPAAVFGQLALCVLGVVSAAGEYGTGTVRATLLAVPRRLRVLAAKSVVLCGLVLAVTEAVAGAAFAAGREVLRPHVALSPGDPGVPRALLGFGLYLTPTAFTGLAVGVLLRHVAGAVACVVAAAFVLPAVLTSLPGPVGRYAEAVLPGMAGQQLMSSGYGDPLLSPWQGSAVMAAWAGLLWLATAYRLTRRDA
jgi:ABC-2 type transport system permease protein